MLFIHIHTYLHTRTKKGNVHVHARTLQVYFWPRNFSGCPLRVGRSNLSRGSVQLRVVIALVTMTAEPLMGTGIVHAGLPAMLPASIVSC